MPRHVGRIGADASLEIGREDAGLDGHLAEQGRLDALAGRLGGEPRLVSEAGFDVVSELVGEPVGRRAIEIRLVLDRDDPLDPPDTVASGGAESGCSAVASRSARGRQRGGPPVERSAMDSRDAGARRGTTPTGGAWRTTWRRSESMVRSPNARRAANAAGSTSITTVSQRRSLVPSWRATTAGRGPSPGYHASSAYRQTNSS